MYLPGWLVLADFSLIYLRYLVYVQSVEISILLLGTMEMVAGMRRQILAQLRSLGLIRQRGPGDIKDLNSNSRNWAVSNAVVGAGLYPNIIKVVLYCCLLLFLYL